MTTVPLLDLRPQLEKLGPELKRAVNDVIDSGHYILGPQVEAFERAIAKYTNTRHAVGVSSGTDALLASLMTIGLQPGDVVVTTPFSFFATAGAVARLGGTPAFVDIDPETYNLDPAALRRWFTEARQLSARCKAIVPVHLFGQCADMAPILAVAEEFNVPVIEDAAQSLGATYPTATGDRQSGSMGQLGCLSFFPSKNLGAIGDAGMVVTSDDALAAKLRVLRAHGASPKYHHSLIGGNFRLDGVQAAALLVKLPHLDAWHRQRQENATYYDSHLNLPRIGKPKIAYSRGAHIYNQYVISVADRRDELARFLRERGIGTEVYYPVPFHEQICFEYLGYGRGAFPCSEYAARHTLAVPIYPDLTRAQQDYVIGAIEQFYA